MARISNEAKVAITIITAIVVAFLGYRVMKDMPLFRQSKILYSYFDYVNGLTAGNYIYINGVQVGSVREIRLVDGDSVRVSMSFSRGVEIPQGSVAYLESAGLFDAKSIVIERGESSENIDYGGTIQGEYRGGVLEMFSEEGKELSGDVSQSFKKLNTLLEQLNGLVTEKNQNKISQILDNLQGTTVEIEQLMQQKQNDLASSIDHAQRFFANLDTVSTNNKETIDSVLVHMNRSLARIEKLSGELKTTSSKLNDILAKINSGKGSLGKLVNDPSLYNNLDSLSAEMKILVKNINENPRRYLKHMRLIEVF